MFFTKNKFKIFLTISILIFAILTLSSVVYSIKTTDLGIINITSDDVNVINNTNAPDFVLNKLPYDYSPLYAESHGFEVKKNKMVNKEGNINYTFITEYFLPIYWNNREKWSNCQSLLLKDEYIYILVSYPPNKGRIVRYNMETLNKYKVNKGKNLDDLRKLGFKIANGNKLTKKEKELKKAIKVGPIFETGHGQSLSYNPKTNSLWMWQNTNITSYKLNLMEINMTKLKPESIYRFSVRFNNTLLNRIQNLDFDNEGNFYFDKKVGTINSKPDEIFSGKLIREYNNSNASNNSGNLNKSKIKTTLNMDILAIIQQRPGTHGQFIAINPRSNRLYLGSDSVFYNMPVDKLRSNTLTADDMNYVILDTKREFEGMGFDKNGTEYLLVLRGPEILKSTTKIVNIDKFS
ncbi:hypothetical protein [Methanobrevibacter filiformis]|uniref:Uncharacterized protein n=1 Tax=Methanobrevibacter filiformis TaxID=55758 RepID=A0A166CV74_9EURY|nr:hypothetical protein [Methanobrevibacter filiformis]KZX17047.1 hypothetical protein MBFIL_03920 [Methanobrevibacter filiformis]